MWHPALARELPDCPFATVERYTLRRFLGRVPLCGTGVTSVIERTFKPEDCSARIADSRPGPGPFTNTSTVCIPWSIARRAAPSALICAAYGVLLRDPLNPAVPALPHEMALPFISVIVTSVLLKVA
jgi:hypothetical protein